MCVVGMQMSMKWEFVYSVTLSGGYIFTPVGGDNMYVRADIMEYVTFFWISAWLRDFKCHIEFIKQLSKRVNIFSYILQFLLFVNNNFQINPLHNCFACLSNTMVLYNWHF